MIISGLGGLIGVVFGIAVAWIFPLLFSNFQTRVEPSSVLLALGVSAGIGIFFGWYPARRAAGLRPVEALRYE